ncbi:MAG TPA: hypothetical protein PKW94_02530 [Candidatus Dojkabacteria bacterium]|nr:hypothetical protein [Candidatus Dojkabacteria bacterium]
MSKLLRRALKISVIPAILMIVGKFLGIFVTSVLYDLQFNIDNDISGIFSVQIYFTDSETTLFVNSMSNLTMILSLLLPILYFIIKTYLYTEAHNNPKTIIKMTKLNLLNWITKKDTSFLKTFIWCAFLWLATAITITHSIQGNTYPWIAITSGVIAFLVTLFTIKTFELETDKIYPIEKKYF